MPPSTVSGCQFHADKMPVYGPPTLTWYGTATTVLLVQVRSSTLAHTPLLAQGVRTVAVTAQAGTVPGCAVATGAAGGVVTGYAADVGAGVGSGGGGEDELGTGGGGEGDVGIGVGIGVGVVVGSWVEPWNSTNPPLTPWHAVARRSLRFEHHLM